VAEKMIHKQKVRFLVVNICGRLEIFQMSEPRRILKFINQPIISEISRDEIESFTFW